MNSKLTTIIFLLFLVFLTACKQQADSIADQSLTGLKDETVSTPLTQEDLSDIESDVKEITIDDLTGDLEADMVELSVLEENI